MNYEVLLSEYRDLSDKIAEMEKKKENLRKQIEELFARENKIQVQVDLGDSVYTLGYVRRINRKVDFKLLSKLLDEIRYAQVVTEKPISVFVIRKANGLVPPLGELFE